MKKYFVILLVFLMLIIPSVLFNGGDIAYAEDSQPNIIDMYLIGGQSNAAGYSQVKSGVTAREQDILEQEIFSNVMYGGQIDRLRTTLVSKQNWLEFSNFKTNVTIGYGCASDRIGPEYGIASMLNSSYSTSNKAFIFKSAAGGTSLQDNSNASGDSYGNWYPRSLWENGYTPNIESATNDSTGLQYLLFVENFKKVYNELKNNGYTPIVKGMAWMQGEEDMGLGCENYDVVLETFITDIRADLVNITGDNGLFEMPFVIGNIASTFSIYNNPGVPIINEKQKRVAEKLDNVATVSTDDLIIVNEKGEKVGTDQFHFSAKDAYTLGKRFGSKLLEMEITNHGNVVLNCKNGSAEYEFDKDNKLIKLKNVIPNEGYHLSYIILKGIDNGKDRRIDLTEFSNNGINIDIESTVDLTIRYKFDITFAQTKKTVIINNDDKCGYINSYPIGLTQAVGTIMKIGIVPRGENVVEKVEYNGQVLQPNVDGLYEFTIIDDNNIISVKYEKQSEYVTPSNNKKGMNSTIFYIIGGSIILCGCFTVLFIVLKKVRKEKK